MRTPEALATNRSRAMNPIIIGGYFRDLKTLLEDNELIDKPHLIWNADETSVPFTHAPTKVVARSGSRRVPGRVSNSRDTITMLPCINAAGIVKGKTMASITAFDTAAAPEGLKFTYQKSGWMEDVLSTEWFDDIFLKQCGPERPQLLIWDSHSSHETRVLEKARANNIIIYTFPRHTTHCLCPLDIAIFRPFKASYNKVCSEYMNVDPTNTIGKATVCPLINKAFEKAFRRGNVAGAFQAAGIVPWNPLAIKATDFVPSQPHDICNTVMANDAHPLSYVSGPGVQEIVAPNTETILETIPEEIATTSVLPDLLLQPQPEASVAVGEATLPLEVVDEEGNCITMVDIPVNQSDPDDWVTDVNAIFGTMHRLLTSDEIINIKREQKEKKEQNEKAKEERKRKREEKSLSKPPKKEKVSMTKGT